MVPRTLRIKLYWIRRASEGINWRYEHCFVDETTMSLIKSIFAGVFGPKLWLRKHDFVLFQCAKNQLHLCLNHFPGLSRVGHAGKRSEWVMKSSRIRPESITKKLHDRRWDLKRFDLAYSWQ